MLSANQVNFVAHRILMGNALLFEPPKTFEILLWEGVFLLYTVASSPFHAGAGHFPRPVGHTPISSSAKLPVASILLS